MLLRMALQVLIVPDKFKGTLTAAEAAAAMARGWRRERPADGLELLPMSDGGDGFGEVMSAALNARVKTVQTVDSLGQPCTAQWWWHAATGTAIIESAKIMGLAQLPAGAPHPFERDTFGLGAAVRAAAAVGARRCLVGIGGSATNDGGFGLARSLDWEFFDRAGAPITRWPELHRLHSLQVPRRKHWFPSLIVAVDVRNRLLGARGCTRVYGPQKGLLPEDFAAAERCLRRLATVTRRQLGRDYAIEPGSGAAGGLGFGFRCFLGARLEPGFELFAHHAGLARRLRAADLVLTGEGAIDKSTLMGKGVGQVADWCRRRGIPCLGLAGAVTARHPAKGGFTQARGLVDLTTLEEAKARPAHWLTELAREMGRSFVGGPIANH